MKKNGEFNEYSSKSLRRLQLVEAPSTAANEARFGGEVYYQSKHTLVSQCQGCDYWKASQLFFKYFFFSIYILLLLYLEK